MLIAVCAILLAAGIHLEPRSSNCGGNSSALNGVKTYSMIVRMAIEENSDHEFSVATATPLERRWLAEIAHDFWIPTARYLVSPQPCRDYPSEPRRVIIVCDRSFTNVPRRLVGSAPPAHAVGFSDGTCGLISVAEFQALDRSSLVPLEELLREPGATDAGL